MPPSSILYSLCHASEVIKLSIATGGCRLPKKPHHSSQKPIQEARLSKEEDLPCRSALSNCHRLRLCEVLFQEKPGGGAERRKLEMASCYILSVITLRISKENNQIILTKKLVKS